MWSLGVYKRKSFREKKSYSKAILSGWSYLWNGVRQEERPDKKMSNLIWQELTCKIKDLSMVGLNIKFTCVKFQAETGELRRVKAWLS